MARVRREVFADGITQLHLELSGGIPIVGAAASTEVAKPGQNAAATPIEVAVSWPPERSIVFAADESYEG